MTLEQKTHTLKRDLIRAFAAFDAWFDKDEAFHQYKPPGHDHGARAIFEQVTHFCATLLNPVYNKKSDDYDLNEHDRWDESEFDQRIERIANEVSVGAINFQTKSTTDVRIHFRDALDQCLCHLELASIGQGFDYEFDLSNQNLKMDLHHRVCLLEHFIKKQLHLLDTIEKIYHIQQV